MKLHWKPNVSDLVNHTDERIFKETRIYRRYYSIYSGIRYSFIQTCLLTGKTGYNVLKPSTMFPWYTGDTLLQLMEKFSDTKRNLESTVHFPILVNKSFTFLIDVENF